MTNALKSVLDLTLMLGAIIGIILLYILLVDIFDAISFIDITLNVQKKKYSKAFYESKERE